MLYASRKMKVHMESLLLFTLTRKETSDEGTFGVLKGEGLSLHTAELPWRNNASRVSCIPAGRYSCRPYSSARFPNVYEVTRVPNRSAILIHTGNNAGDVSKGFRSDVEGCILLGLGRGIVKGQKAVTPSIPAMDKFRAVVKSRCFELLITDETGVEG